MGNTKNWADRPIFLGRPIFQNGQLSKKNGEVIIFSPKKSHWDNSNLHWISKMDSCPFLKNGLAQKNWTTCPFFEAAHFWHERSRCNAFFSPRQFIILWTHTTVEYWERCYFVNIFIGMCSKVYLFMAVLCWFLFPMWCVLYHFSINETNGMFRPRLIPFSNRHHVSKNRRRT